MHLLLLTPSGQPGVSPSTAAVAAAGTAGAVQDAADTLISLYPPARGSFSLFLPRWWLTRGKHCVTLWRSQGVVGSVPSAVTQGWAVSHHDGCWPGSRELSPFVKTFPSRFSLWEMPPDCPPVPQIVDFLWKARVTTKKRNPKEQEKLDWGDCFQDTKSLQAWACRFFKHHLGWCLCQPVKAEVDDIHPTMYRGLALFRALGCGIPRLGGGGSLKKQLDHGAGDQDWVRGWVIELGAEGQKELYWYPTPSPAFPFAGSFFPC